MLKIMKRITAGVAAVSCLTTILPSALFASAADPIKYEAEDCVIVADTYKITEDESVSGGKFVDFEGDFTCTFTVNVEKPGYYDVNLVSKAKLGNKKNKVQANGVSYGEFESKVSGFYSSTVPNVKLNAGENTVEIVSTYGWIQFDYMTITDSATVNTDYYSGVSSQLINSNSTGTTQRLMQFLCDSYGKYIISGQQADNGYQSSDVKSIEALTGELPAIIGLDLMDYSQSSATEHGSTSIAIEKAIEVSQAGGIVSLTWHWRMYDEYLLDGKDDGLPRWWNSFYSRNVDFTKFDLEKIMSNPNSAEYKRLVSDIDVIAEQLKRLQELDIPVLFRPLHEAGGDYRYNNPWFWWGSAGGETYIKLWKLMYDRLANVAGLNNLIWVWNGQSVDYYPGDDYVDIISEDIYNYKNDFQPNSNRFIRANEYTESDKIVALSETGNLFDPDEAFDINAKWSWFMSWTGEYSVNGDYNNANDKAIWKTVYNSDKVITLSELPDFQTYEIEDTTPATNVKVNLSEKEVKLGDMFHLAAALTPTNSTEIPVWSSSDEKVAVVDEIGTVTAVGIGEATITCTVKNGKSSSCTVYVSPVKVENLKVTSSTSSSVTLSWAAIDTVDDYDVMILDKDGVELNVVTSDSNTFEVKGLDSNSSYMFRVRAHKTYNGKAFYGEYSALVSGQTATSSDPNRIDTDTSGNGTPTINTTTGSNGSSSSNKADNSANTGSAALGSFGLTLAGAYVILASKKRK